MPRQRSKSANHVNVLAVLEKSGRALSAYEILDELRPCGISAPTVVYRALERLLAEGAAHRVETLNRYVVCRHRDHGGGQLLLAICDDCGRVDELSGGRLLERLSASASREGFSMRAAVVELLGRCGDCAAAAGRETSHLDDRGKHVTPA